MLLEIDLEYVPDENEEEEIRRLFGKWDEPMREGKLVELLQSIFGFTAVVVVGVRVCTDQSEEMP